MISNVSKSQYWKQLFIGFRELQETGVSQVQMVYQDRRRVDSMAAFRYSLTTHRP